jgi:hypothetical protein
VSLKEKFNVTHSSPRNERHSPGCSTNVGQELERSQGKMWPQTLLGFLQERQDSSE